ncbi:MAG: hypothetical protein JW976_04430, partial [Syntrophaceae bacterium]|nr:hypothetical protein [Syntrophaceae bacterium]
MKKFNFIIWTIYVITFCFSLFLCSSVYSQVINTAFERITTKDGLPQSTVNYIIQDKKGFMWFATFGGICRYDGYTFKVYSHIADDKTSLSNNGIIYFFEDRDGYIWIANNANEGLDKFDPVNESFTNYKNDPKDSTSISSDEVYSVYQDRSGNIWVFTANALNLVVNKKIGNKTVIRFKRFYNTSNTIPFNMGYEDSSGKLLLFADHLYYFNRGNNEILKTDVMLAQSTIKSIGKDREGNLWLGTSLNGMIKLIYNKKTGGYKRADLGKVNVTPNNRNYILIDNQDNIWIATESKGLFQYIEKEGRLINIVNNKIDLNSISDNTIYSLYIDRSGVFWIGTFSQGLCKYNLFEKPFYHFKSIPGDDNTLSGNVISSIHSTIPGELWVGVDLDGGINRFVFRDNKEPEVFHYMHDPKNGNSIGGNSILCLVQRKNGEVWAGSAGGSVSKIIPEKYGSNKKPVITRYSFYRWTFSIFEDRQGTIWGGTWDGGLWRYHEKTDLVTFFQNDPDNPSSLCDNIIWAITEDNSENIWIGGHGEGLSILPAKEKNKPNPEFINFKHEEENIQSLSNNTIHVFCQDHTGTMWIGTASGLNKVIRRDNNFSDIDTDHELKFFSYHINDGLPSDNILGIVQDNNGNLWLSTSNGISKFNLSENSFTNYYESDGLQSNEFWHNAYFKDQSGKLYLGGNNGFNAFYPDSIKPNPFPPRVVFTDFRLFYKSVKIGEKINDDIILSKSINETSEIVLSHRNNIFSIEFAALQYAHPDKNKYAYKMEGFNKEWVET